jgi:hypothetical protein
MIQQDGLVATKELPAIATARQPGAATAGNNLELHGGAWLDEA